VKREYIPNLLCVLRMLLVPPIVWLLAQAEYRIALALFVVAGATDALDGWLAKHFDWRTQLGGLLDPVADKLLLSTLFITLGVLALIPPWLVVFVVARDVIIAAGALAYRALIGTFTWRARPLSKLNTAAQLLFVLGAMTHAAYAVPPASVLAVIGAVIVATTLLSGGDYVWRWGRRAWLAAHGTAA
jgi:cardiolipin synthase (CMP-forming)